jgi:hypothetical protein
MLSSCSSGGGCVSSVRTLGDGDDGMGDLPGCTNDGRGGGSFEREIDLDAFAAEGRAIARAVKTELPDAREGRTISPASG